MDLDLPRFLLCVWCAVGVNLRVGFVGACGRPVCVRRSTENRRWGWCGYANRWIGCRGVNHNSQYGQGKLEPAETFDSLGDHPLSRAGVVSSTHCNAGQTAASGLAGLGWGGRVTNKHHPSLRLRPVGVSTINISTPRFVSVVKVPAGNQMFVNSKKRDTRAHPILLQFSSSPNPAYALEAVLLAQGPADAHTT